MPITRVSASEVLVGLVALGANADEGELAYHLKYPGSTVDRVAVSIQLPAGASASEFLMPRAVPMGYSEQPWAEFVSGVRAFGADGETIAVERRLGPRWAAVDEGAPPLARVSYEVDIREMERRILEASDTSKLRDDYLGILGYSVFGYLEGLEARPIELTLEGPDGWPLFTTLAPLAEPAKGRARFWIPLRVSVALLLEVRTQTGPPGHQGKGPCVVIRTTRETRTGPPPTTSMQTASKVRPAGTEKPALQDCVGPVAMKWNGRAPSGRLSWLINVPGSAAQSPSQGPPPGPPGQGSRLKRL